MHPSLGLGRRRGAQDPARLELRPASEPNGRLAIGDDVRVPLQSDDPLPEAIFATQTRLSGRPNLCLGSAMLADCRLHRCAPIKSASRNISMDNGQSPGDETPAMSGSEIEFAPG